MASSTHEPSLGATGLWLGMLLPHRWQQFCRGCWSAHCDIVQNSVCCGVGLSALSRSRAAARPAPLFRRSSDCRTSASGTQVSRSTVPSGASAAGFAQKQMMMHCRHDDDVYTPHGLLDAHGADIRQVGLPQRCHNPPPVWHRGGASWRWSDVAQNSSRLMQLALVHDLVADDFTRSMCSCCRIPEAVI